MTEFRIQNSNSDKTAGEPAMGSRWSLLNSEFCTLNSVIFAVALPGSPKPSRDEAPEHHEQHERQHHRHQWRDDGDHDRAHGEAILDRAGDGIERSATDD